MATPKVRGCHQKDVSINERGSANAKPSARLPADIHKARI